VHVLPLFAHNQQDMETNKSTLALLSPVCLGLTLASAFSQVSHSPVGTWEISASGRNPSAGFVTFNGDFTATGYGMSLSSFGIYTFQGTWALDAKGNTVAQYSENLYFERDAVPQTFSGSFIGKATTGKRLVGRTVASDGNSTVTGTPPLYYPDVSGSWVAYVTEGRTTVPEFITVVPSNVAAGVFIFSGTGAGPSGSFVVGGEMLVTSKGKVVVLGESDFADGTKSFSSLTGTLNLLKQTGLLTGITDSGYRLRTRITR
jgi:hypothetical protein